MGSSTDRALAERAWALAARQHGVVARRQLLELGLSAQAIQHRLVRGRLHRIDRGIYAVGRPALDREGRWMAAVLACGTGAVLSHGSAAALWGIGPFLAGVEVTIPIASPRRRDGVHVHRRPNLLSAHTTVRKAIPVTNPARTAIDLAVRLRPAELERMMNEADRLGLFNPEGLLAALDAYPGVRGVGRLRSVLGARTFRLTRIGAGATLFAHSGEGEAAVSAHAAGGQWLSRRLLLARSRLGRRDRRTDLPPHPVAAGARSPARSDPSRRRPDAASLHSRTGALRVQRRARDPGLARFAPPTGTGRLSCRQ